MRGLVTGSNGLVGSQCVKFLCKRGWQVFGVDNDMRSYFFGEDSSTKSVGQSLREDFDDFTFFPLDIRERSSLATLLHNAPVDLIIHAAGQPSHDWAAKEPLTDFEVNAVGTINILEAYRLYCPSASFVFTSTNKVYGDRPNQLQLTEEDLRLEHYDESGELGSIDENMSIDHCLHSVFGASKVSADIMVQEYGRYFNLNTAVFRCGCLTGPDHKGAKLHGFLSYLIKCAVKNEPYTINGSGKQVRDNLHAWDLANMFWHFYQDPRPGVVYNAGGGRDNSISILEAIEEINKILASLGKEEWTKYEINQSGWRTGDHKWYISDLSKFEKDFPEWEIENSLNGLLKEMVEKELSC